jgi:cardiolipin synthase
MQVENTNPPRALNWPNRISLARLLLVGPFAVLLINQQPWPWARHAAMAVFAVMAVSDLVDGMLARRMGAMTRLGAILDPLADKVLVIFSVVLLSMDAVGAAGYRLPNWVTVAVVGKDLWVIAGTLVVYLVTDRLRVRPTIAGKASTLGQLLLVGYALSAADVARLSPPAAHWGIIAGSWAVAALSVIAIISYTRLGLAFVSTEGKLLENPSGKPPGQQEPTGKESDRVQHD